MTTKTLLELRNDARERADLQHAAQAVDDLTLNTFINQAFHELNDLMITSDDARIFAKNATIPPSVGRFSFRLPYDFYRLISLHVRQHGFWVPGTAADSAQYAELADSQNDYRRPEYFVRWDIKTGERFVFIFPETTDGKDVAITYFPQPVELSIDSDSVDNPASWLEYVSVGAAIRMKDKLELEVGPLLAARNGISKRIEDGIQQQDFNGPRRIRQIAYRYGQRGGWGRG